MAPSLTHRDSNLVLNSAPWRSEEGTDRDIHREARRVGQENIKQAAIFVS